MHTVSSSDYPMPSSISSKEDEIEWEPNVIEWTELSKRMRIKGKIGDEKSKYFGKKLITK